jgi:hypothetical protein
MKGKKSIASVLLVCLLLAFAAVPASAQTTIQGSDGCYVYYNGGFPSYACPGPVVGADDGYVMLPYAFILSLWYYFTW